MSDTTPYDFQSYAIYRRAEVHIAQPTCYDTSTKWREAKFVFGLDEQRAWYGFYIEKNDGPMDDTWDWLRFLAALASNATLQQEVTNAMRQLGLNWRLWIGGELVAQVRIAHGSLVWEWRNRDGVDELSWPDFVYRLRAIEAGKFCALYLCTCMDKDQAIAAGIHIVDSVTEVYRELLKLYRAST